MDEFSSQLQLVPKRHLQKSVRSAPHSVRRKKTEETKDKSVVFVLVLLILAVIAVTCIVGFYISHIQEHVRRLEQRIIMLEQRPCAQPGNADGAESEQESENGEFVSSKVKRGVLDEEESEHHRMYHHGIASHNIAYLFGDLATVKEKTNNTDVNHDYRFKPNRQLPHHKDCKTLYVRKDQQKYCTSPHKGAPDKYMTSNNNHGYDYFKKAAWMLSKKWNATFDLNRDGKIVVRKPGIYIIHANVHFISLGKQDKPSIGVYKTNSTGGDGKLLGICVVALPSDLSSKKKARDVYPCASWQLAHLNAGDIVYMHISKFTWFRVEQETLHLALIRLNNELLEKK